MGVPRRVAVAVAVVASIMGAAGLWGAGAASGYGSGALHQVEISSSIAPNFFGPGTGGGIWLWIELDGSQSGGGGDYTGSDCLHNVPFIGPTGATADSGEVQWTSNGSTITITGVVIGAHHTPVTITVPESGHMSTNNTASVFSAPVGGLPGTVQVEVAP